MPPAEVAADLLTLLLVDLAACGSAKLLQKRFLRFALEFRGLLSFFHAIGVRFVIERRTWAGCGGSWAASGRSACLSSMPAPHAAAAAPVDHPTPRIAAPPITTRAACSINALPLDKV